jgi:hypothetical protein
VRSSSFNLIRSAERDSDGFLKLESLDFFETPSPTKIGSEKRNQKPGNQKRQRICRHSSPFAATRGVISSHFNFHLLSYTVFHYRAILSGDD